MSKIKVNRLENTATADGGIDIDSSGKCGIGTAAPGSFSSGANTLVAGTASGNAGITINTDQADQIGSIFFAEGSGANAVGRIRYEHANNAMVFSTVNAERMRILSSGGLTFNGDTAAANALDDYEEGTWTPVPTDGSNTSPLSNIECRYTKIGRLVYIRGSLLNINTTGLTSGSTISITGLPFALSPNVTNARCAFPVATDAITTTKGVVASISENSTSFQLYEVDDAVYGTSIKVSALVHGDADIWVNFSYETA